MVQHTPKLVTGVLKALDAAREKDTKALNEQLKAILGTMQTINEGRTSHDIKCCV